MALVNDIPELINHIQSQGSYINQNAKLFEAFEGNLCNLVREVMRKTLSANTYQVAEGRIAPINVLTKVVDKLSTIYQQMPSRQISPDNDQDSDLLKWYEDCFRMNRIMNSANEYMVMSKVAAVMPYVHMNKPRLRALPANKFIVYSTDIVDPTNVTHFITIQGTCLDSYGQSAVKYHVWTDTEFLIMNSKGEVLRSEMLALGNPNGVNPYGRIPAVYVNKSDSSLIPPVDADMLQMTILIPLFLSDLNVGAMFTVWPILWTRDVDLKDLAYSPNTVISMHTDPSVDKTPEIGTIEPKMDIPNQIALLQSELGFWLSTKNIRPASVGELTVDSFSSGVSKMIDEGDTVEERKRHVTIFTEVEQRLWDLVINHMHRVWVSSGMIENKALFAPGSKVEVEFPVQLPVSGRGQVVRDLRDEVDAGFMSKREAIKRLNPGLTAKEIDAILLEIEEDDIPQLTINTSGPQPVEPVLDNADDNSLEDNAEASQQLPNL